ncbi:MAG: YicC/YloC family endoribonuclease [Planktomarina sp.]|nr:YicC/YloC family endoribonuclease [Planktomarina sp.]
MLTSMTGIAALSGAIGPYDWSMELRGVNNKGLDIRARVPDWLVGLDQVVRKAIAADIARVSLQFGLKVSLSEGTVQRQIDPVKLEHILKNALYLAKLAKSKGLEFSPIGLSDISSQNGFMDFEASDLAKTDLMRMIVGELPELIAQFQVSRQDEGQALHGVLEAGVVEMERLLQLSETAIETRADEFETNFKAAIARLKQDIEPARLAQEMAILAVKNDVTEEIDRLIAHIAAARSLLASQEPAGRKFDFLMQEFNREANTLCSKSNSKSLTAIGLEMKVLIDQMREQVQNVE